MALRDEIERSLAEAVIDVPQSEVIQEAVPMTDPSIQLSSITTFVWQRQAALETAVFELADRIEKLEQGASGR